MEYLIEKLCFVYVPYFLGGALSLSIIHFCKKNIEN